MGTPRKGRVSGKRKSESRATPENPTFDLNSPAAWDYLTAGDPSSSGVRVTPKSALGYAPFWRGVNLRANTVAKIPLYVYERVSKGRSVADKLPVYNLLRWKPNRYMTAFTFFQVLIAHKWTIGNAYAFIDRDATATPIELLPLNPNNVTPVRVNGVLNYVVQAAGESRMIRQDDVLHIKGLGFDGLEGYDVLTYHRDTLGTGIAARDYGSRFFSNDQRPGMVLEFPGKLSEQTVKKLSSGIAALKPGLENRHKLAILEEGGKLHPFSQTAKDSQLDELSRLSILQTANILGIPPHKLGDTSRQGYNSLEQEDQSFADSLDEDMVPIEQECRDKLLTEDQKRSDSHYFEFLRAALVRADIAARNAAYQTMRRNGVLTANEWRAMENMNPISTEAGGDTYIIEANMQPMSALTQTVQSDPDPEPDPEIVIDDGSDPGDENDARGRKVLEAHRASIGEAARLMFRRIGLDAKRKARGGGDAFWEWLNEHLADDHRAVVLESFGGVLRSLRVLRSNAGDSLAEGLTAALLAGVHDSYLESTGVGAADIKDSVDRATAKIEQGGTDWLTRKVTVKHA